MPVMEYQPIYSITEAAKVLKVNKNFIYDEIRCGNITALKLGSYKIRGTDLERYITQFPEEKQQDKTA